MIFVSHSSKDAIEANRLVNVLEDHGMKCWIAPRDIEPGLSFPAQIVKAIRECDSFIVIVSNYVNQSGHILNELARAFDYGKRIIPYMISNVSFSDDYLYYISQIQWISAYSDMDAAMDSLIKILSTDKNCNTSNQNTPRQRKVNVGCLTSPIDTSSKTLRIVGYHELVRSGMTALDIAKRLVENDYNLYPEMTAENEGEPEQWAEYLSTFPETFRYLVTGDNTIVGNWSFLAVSEEIHAEKLRKGELTEDVFSLDETEYLLLPGDYVGYLLNLSVNVEYNSAKNLNMLLDSLAKQMLSFAGNDIFFKAWYVNVFRKDHEAMYRRLGFHFFTNNKHFGKLYYLDCEAVAKQKDIKKRGKMLNNDMLMELYHEHYSK